MAAENDADSYKLSACGFHNQPVEIMGKAVFDEALQAGLIALAETEAA